ncbi:Presenilin-1 [Cichlidogyrus casuarinus]|uniref:Presenilin-1 n=1 Tax=Cichlidogyrus casuarinus TaxID=1844966 RepID=A0ABD2PZC5_9PLAT
MSKNFPFWHLEVVCQEISSLLVPVLVCIVLNLFVIALLPLRVFYASSEALFIFAPFHSTHSTVTTTVWQTLANVGIMLAAIVTATVLLYLLYKYECYKVIKAWMVFSTMSVLFFLSFTLFTDILTVFGVFVDFPTMTLFLWNYAIFGCFAMHWKAPLLAHRAYLITVAMQLSIFFLKYLPKWTCWLLLVVLALWGRFLNWGVVKTRFIESLGIMKTMFIVSENAVYLVNKVSKYPGLGRRASGNLRFPLAAVPRPGYLDWRVECGFMVDLFAVLAPCGPLRLLLQLTQERGSKLDSVLVYSTKADKGSTKNKAKHEEEDDQEESKDAPMWRKIKEGIEAREENGMMLGLGDFIFYSLLIGRAAVDSDYVVVLCCIICICLGLTLTILLLTLFQAALPALPISILLATTCYFWASYILSPFVHHLVMCQILL